MRDQLQRQIAKLEERLAPANRLRQRLSDQMASDLRKADALEQHLKDTGRIPKTGAVDPARVEAVAADTVDAAMIPPEMADAEAAEDLAAQIDGLTTVRDRVARSRQQLQAKRDQIESDYNTGLAKIDAGLADVRHNLAAIRTTLPAGAEAGQAVRDLAARATTAPATLEGYPQLLDDMRQVLKLQAAAGLRPAEVDNIAALLDGAAKQYEQIETLGATNDLYRQRLKEMAKNPKAASQVVKSIVTDGWTPMARNLLHPDDAIEVTNELYRALNNVTTALDKENAWRLFGYYTDFFKTYATARPGFHVRNAFSGIFMNLVDRVRMRNMFEAPSMWRRYMKDPAKFISAGTERERYALSVVMGSGSGGAFNDVLTAGEISNRAHRKLVHNWFTKMNRKAGTYVEGPLRLSMALDSFDKGMSMGEALARVVKYHFDYSQTSKLDRAARRMIPFWTFMSRNLPLQLEQMVLRPRMYQQYRALVNNFAQPADPLTPQYWLSQGAWTLDEHAEDRHSPWYLMPDLPFTNITEPFDALARGDVGKAVLSDINPGILAPLEAFGFGKKIFTGAPIEGYEEDSSTVMQGLGPLFGLLGGAERGASGDWVNKESYEHLARSLIPTLDLIERFTDTSGNRAGRQDETFYRQALGLPVRQLTPELRRSTANTEFWNRRDQQTLEAQLQRG